MITREEVTHVARLARIELGPEEEQEFEKDLSAILTFIEELNQVDTENIEPLAGGALMENNMRSDAKADSDLESESDLLLKLAPETKERYVRVKAVFE